jgi:hypothetical protein
MGWWPGFVVATVRQPIRNVGDTDISTLDKPQLTSELPLSIYRYLSYLSPLQVLSPNRNPMPNVIDVLLAMASAWGSDGSEHVGV